MVPADRSNPANGEGHTRQPVVSVVIAAYNAEPYIAETCRSVLKQTYPALEIIVVDDGSTDGTARIVSDLAASDSRVRLIRQENRGVAAARNRAIDVAIGEFVAPLDADDIWTTDKIARQVRRLEDAGPDGAMVYCWWAWINHEGSVLDRSPRWRVEGRVLERLVEVNFTGSASVPLYRRSCVQELGGYKTTLRDDGAQGCEDWDLALRIAERYSVAVVPATLVGYRRHPTSMSTGVDTMWRSQSQIMKDLALRHPSVPDHVFRRSAGQFALHLAGVEFWSGRYLKACLWALRARPLSLTLAVFPHAARLVLRRLLGLDRVRPKWAPPAGGFEEQALPEPLIPYDRIYTRHWDGQRD